MTARTMNVKQAEKWLQKLRTERPESYKDMLKHLKRYDKSQDNYECYVKMNSILFNHSKLTEELNLYLQDGNKFPVSKNEAERIKQLVKYLLNHRPVKFQSMNEMMNGIKDSNSLSEQELNKAIKAFFKETAKGDPELQIMFQRTFNVNSEDLIKTMDLQHLRSSGLKNNTRQDIVADQEITPDKQAENGVVKQVQRPNKFIREDKPVKQIVKPKIFPFAIAGNISDEKLVLKQLEKALDSKTYEEVMKLLQLYKLNVISKQQICQLIKPLEYYYQEQIEHFKDIIQSRETDRRRNSAFKPLSDLDATNFNRISPSYVVMPNSYPSSCSQRTNQLEMILNSVYVSVPHGSEENFNVRNKNINEANLLQAEDKRYQFNLYSLRLQKTLEIIDKILKQSNNNNNNKSNQIDLNRYIQQIVNLGTIQLMYKNLTKQAKQQFEYYLKSYPEQTCHIIKSRLLRQQQQLNGIKQIHANKMWLQIANKNFYKALDLKGFQFKSNQKQKMKGTAFIAQLNQRAKVLQTGIVPKIISVGFEQKRPFFSVLNSFQGSSRTQKCKNRVLPAVTQYDLSDMSKRRLYPVIIMAFENQRIFEITYKFILYYLDLCSLSESEKTKTRNFLHKFMKKYMKWNEISKSTCTDKFNQEQLYNIVTNVETQQPQNLDGWVVQQQKSAGSMEQQGQQQQPILDFKTLKDTSSGYSYLPTKSQQSSLIYCSEHLYTFVRFLYALYERLIRAEQVAQTQYKFKLFQYLFYSCVKAKQGVKFQQHLSYLFGKYAYLFGTIYKLLQSLVKSIASLLGCSVNQYSLRLSGTQCQDIYQLSIVKYCLANNLNLKLLRLNYQPTTKLLTVNCFQSYYKHEESIKDLAKRIQQISFNIEIYAYDNLKSNNLAKKRHTRQYIEKNRLELIFQANTIKMVNHNVEEDLLATCAKKQPITKLIKRDLKRSYKLLKAMF